MPYHIGVGGAWKLCSGAHVGVGGVWKRVSKMYIGVGGVWKQFYTFLGATLNNATYTHNTVTPANATAGIKVDADGSIYRLQGASYTSQYVWLTGGGTNVDYQARWTSSVGTLSSGTEATWETCNVDLGYNRNNNSDTPGSETVTGTLEIRMAAAPNTVLATATITLTATVGA